MARLLAEIRCAHAAESAVFRGSTLTAGNPDPPRGRDEFADVPDMLRALRAMPPGSPEYIRHRDRVVTQCLPLADRIAYRFLRRGESFDDLQQIARVGLLNAINRFDPDSGSEFLSYAVPTMVGEIRRHFRDHGWAMHVPRRLKELHVRIGVVTPLLIQSLGRAPTAGDLAAALEVPREDIVESLVAANAYSLRSIDAPLGDRAGATPALADTLGSLDTQLDVIHDRETLRPLLAALPERERTAVHLRFFAGMTQTQIAEQMGISQMHVSRILAKTLLQLRESMLERPTVRDEPAGRP